MRNERGLDSPSAPGNPGHYAPDFVPEVYQGMTFPIDKIRFVKELYPRIKPSDDAIERYRDAIDKLPPITVARGGILVDGYHRWQAHVREGLETIQTEDLGNLSDAEILSESYRRNASHGYQLSRQDKRKAAAQLWASLAHLSNEEREREITDLLAVSIRFVREQTKDARKAERDTMQEKVERLYLSCLTERQISDATGVLRPTVNRWVAHFCKRAKMSHPPGASDGQPWGVVQHFDVWSFPSNDREGGGQQSYFGACPPQVIQNLLWFYTKPGQVVFDPFAGSGTTLEVAHLMGRRAWVSDIRGNHYSPHLDIHQHDITTGWPAEWPQNQIEPDLIFLDPPYWKQASGRYSQEPNEMAEMDLTAFMSAWNGILKTCKAKLADGGKVAYIISPTELRDEGKVVDHAMEMAMAAVACGFRINRRIVVTYQTQQATGQQVTWARENRRLLKLYRDLVVLEAVK